MDISYYEHLITKIKENYEHALREFEQHRLNPFIERKEKQKRLDNLFVLHASSFARLREIEDLIKNHPELTLKIKTQSNAEIVQNINSDLKAKLDYYSSNKCPACYENYIMGADQLIE